MIYQSLYNEDMRDATGTKIFIYHITHVDNINSIIAEGGLWCDSEKELRGLAPVGIAHTHIKDRRARRIVPAGAGGVVADYVPFYFCPRSPMLYAIHTNSVAGYQGGQSNIVHLVIDPDAIIQRGFSFAYSDGAAEMEISRFFDTPDQMAQLDWKVIRSWSWRNTQTDNDRKRRKQAEFLVHKFSPWDLILEIGVYGPDMSTRIRSALENKFHKPIVNIRRQWYYDV